MVLIWLTLDVSAVPEVYIGFVSSLTMCVLAD